MSMRAHVSFVLFHSEGTYCSSLPIINNNDWLVSTDELSILECFILDDSTILHKTDLHWK